MQAGIDLQEQGLNALEEFGREAGRLHTRRGRPRKHGRTGIVRNTPGARAGAGFFQLLVLFFTQAKVHQAGTRTVDGQSNTSKKCKIVPVAKRPEKALPTNGKGRNAVALM
jgi:hypothetical protein